MSAEQVSITGFGHTSTYDFPKQARRTDCSLPDPIEFYYAINAGGDTTGSGDAVNGYSGSFENSPYTGPSGGGGTTRPVFSTLGLESGLLPTMPCLAGNVGANIGDVRLNVFGPNSSDSRQLPQLEISLGNAYPTAFSLDSNDDGSLRQEVEFVFKAIRWTTHAINPDGSTTTNSTGWDLVNNKAS